MDHFNWDAPGAFNDPGAQEWLQQILQSAAANHALFGLPCDHSAIREIIERADYVTAIWHQPHFGALVVKHRQAEWLRAQSIPCVDEAAARRLQACYSGRPALLN